MTHLALVDSLEGEADVVEWLDFGRLAFGTYSLLEGDPATNKSSIMIDLAARGSTGRPMPSGLEHREFGTVIVGVEDGLRRTLIPRAMAAGADRAMLYNLRTVPNGRGGRDPFVLPDDLPHLDQLVEKRNVRLVVFDPITSLLARRFSANNDQDVRQALEPLVEWADGRGVCVVGLRHFVKNSSSGNVAYRGLGSIAFYAVARTGNVCLEDEDGQRWLSTGKNSMDELPPSQQYRVERVPYAELDIPDPTGRNSAPRVVWGHEDRVTARELSAAVANPEEREEKRALREAIEEAVRAHGSTTTKEMEALARDLGITNKRLIVAARNDAGLELKRDGRQGPVLWVKPLLNGNGNGYHREGVPPASPHSISVCAQCRAPRSPVPGACPACGAVQIVRISRGS